MMVDVDKWVRGKNGSSYYRNWDDANNRIVDRINDGDGMGVIHKFEHGHDKWTFMKETQAQPRHKKDGRFMQYDFADVIMTDDGRLLVELPKWIEETIEKMYKIFEKEGMTK